MNPLERYEAAMSTLNKVSQTVVERFGGTPTHAQAMEAFRSQRDVALKERDNAVAERDEATSNANEWKKAYDDLVARACADAERLSNELRPLTAEKGEAAAAQ